MTGDRPVIRPSDGSPRRVITGETVKARQAEAQLADSVAGMTVRVAPGLLGRPAPDDTDAVDALAAEQDEQEQRYVANRADLRRMGRRLGR